MDINNISKFLTEIETVSPNKSNFRKIQVQVAQLAHCSFKENDGDILIKCILKYIDYIINIASNKPCKDQMKICRRSFPIITKIISKEMQYTFMKAITKRIFEIVIDDDVQNWCIKKELLKMFISCIENSDRSLRQKTVQELSPIYLFKLMDTVSMCGDFDFQLSLIEVVFRMYGKNTITANLRDLIPESQDLSESFADITADTFDESVRKFLNSLNSSTGKVFSVVCQNVYLGNLRCERPMDGVDGLWVDFNLSANVISWFCNKNSFANKDSDTDSSTENDRIWNLVTLFTSDVEMVQIHRPVKCDAVLIYFKLKDSCLSSFEDNQMIVGAADNLKLVVSYNSNKTTTLLSKILPSLFGSKYSHSSSKVSSSKKIYKPLNVTVSRRGKSELSKSKSDTSSFVPFFDPVGVRTSKSDINTSSRDEASLKRTISISSASTKYEVISIPDSSTHSTALSLELIPLKALKNDSKHQNTENTEYETAQACHELHIDSKVRRCITSASNIKEVKKCSTSINPGGQKIVKKGTIDSETPEVLSRPIKISTYSFGKKSQDTNSILPKKPTPPVFSSSLEEGLYSVEEDINHIQILSGRCSGSNIKYSQLSRSSALTTSTPRKLSDKEINIKFDQVEAIQNLSTDNFETARDYVTETTLTQNQQEFSEDFSSLKVNIFKHKGTMLPSIGSIKGSSIRRSPQNVSEYFQQQSAPGMSMENENENVIVISEDYIKPSQEFVVTSSEKRRNKIRESVRTGENRKKPKEILTESLGPFKVSEPQRNKNTCKRKRVMPNESEETCPEARVPCSDKVSEVKVSEALYRAADFIAEFDKSSDIDSQESSKFKVSKALFTPVQTRLKQKKVVKKSKDTNTEGKENTKCSINSENSVLPLEKITKNDENKNAIDDKIVGDSNVEESVDTNKVETGPKSPDMTEPDSKRVKIMADESKCDFNDGSKPPVQISVKKIGKKTRRGRKLKKDLSIQVIENSEKDAHDDVLEHTDVDLPLHEMKYTTGKTCKAIQALKEDLHQQPQIIEHKEDPDGNLRNSNSSNTLEGICVEDLPSHEINYAVTDIPPPTASPFFIETHKSPKAVSETKEDISEQPDIINQTEHSNELLLGGIILIDNGMEDLPSDRVNDSAVSGISPMATEISKPHNKSDNQTTEIEVTEEQLLESCESDIKPMLSKRKVQTKRRIICESDENEITEYKFDKFDNIKRGLRKNRMKRRTIYDSDDSDKENVEIQHSNQNNLTISKVIQELYVRLEVFDKPRKIEKYMEVETDTQNSCGPKEITTNNYEASIRPVEENAFIEKQFIRVEVKSRVPLKELNDENLIMVMPDEYREQENTDTVFENLKALQEHTTQKSNEFEKKVAHEEPSDAQANIPRNGTDHILVDDRRTGDEQLESKEHEKAVKDRNAIFFKSFFDQTLSTTLGGKRRRKLYNPQDLSYWQDTIEDDSVARLNEPSLIKDVVVVNDENKPEKPIKGEKTKEKRNRTKTTGKGQKQKKESSFRGSKKMKVVNPDFMLEIPNDRDRQKYSHLRPVFHNMLESFRQEIGKDFSDILEKNTPKEGTISKKNKKKNVRRYTKRTMKHKFTDNIVRVAKKSNSSSSDFSFTLRKKLKPSVETPYNSPARVQQKTQVHHTGNNKKINIISDIQIRPKRALLDDDTELLKKAKYDKHNLDVEAFPQDNIILNNEIGSAIYDEDKMNEIVPLNRGNCLPIMSKNITNEEISSWIVTGSPKYNKFSECRYVLKHAYPMFKSLLSTSTVAQEHEDILKICDILQNYV